MAGRTADRSTGQRLAETIAVAAGRTGVTAAVLLALALTVMGLVACGGEAGPGRAGDQAADGEAGALLTAPAGTDSATVDAAADVVRARLARMGVTDATVSEEADGVRVTSSADGYQLHAAAQAHATQIAPVTTAAVGPCNGPGVPSAGPAVRCYVLGPALTGVTAVAGVKVQPASGSGWTLTFSINPDQYQAFRVALEPAGQARLALVTDGTVALEFGAGIPALESALGPPLAEEQARRAAAALGIDTDLPVALQAPPEPTPSGTRVDLDFWTAALGVDICGSWLGNAPSFGLDTGVHSHGDGLVYIHPMKAREAGDNATLGLFLDRGGWTATTDQLALWDGTTHTTGQTCPDGRPAQVRWYVDGVEQRGDPSTFLPHHGQVVVLSFDSTPPGAGSPPQLQSLYVPSLGPAINDGPAAD
jgi:hypothetical protein